MTAYLALAVLGVIAFSLWSFWLTVRPPRLILSETPQSYRLPSEDVTIVGDDGVKLAAWLIPRSGASNATAAEPVVIVLHGYPAEKADMLPIALALHPRFTTLLVDLRYFGKSEGRATTLGFRERRDLARAVDVLASRGVTRIGVFGYSLGGAIGLMTAAEDPRIRAVAAYAPFSDLRALGQQIYSGLSLFKYPLVELMILWTRVFLGADITRPSPVAAATRVSVPVLLMHNPADDQIPFSHAQSLRQALASNPKAEFVFEGPGRHNDLVGDFGQRLSDFFSKALDELSP